MGRNLHSKAAAQGLEIDRNIAQLKRRRQTGRLDHTEFADMVRVEQEKKARVMRRTGGADQIGGARGSSSAQGLGLKNCTREALLALNGHALEPGEQRRECLRRQFGRRHRQRVIQ